MKSNQPEHDPGDDEDTPGNVDKSLSVGKVSFCREKKREMKYFETVYISNKYMFSPLEKTNYK